MRLLAGLLLLLTACTRAADPTPAAMVPVTTPTTSLLSGAVPYLALGDSYTIGQGVPNAADRWPAQLATLARAQGLDVHAPDIIAKTGWTTTNLLDAIAASGNTRTDYGLVTLLIGVNDQYEGQSIDVFRTELRRLLGRATVYAGGRAGRVLVLSIPDWGQSPFASGQNRTLIGQQIDQFNAVALDECQKVGITFSNITPFTRSAGADPTQFVDDGLHYTGASMAPWAQRALGAVKQMQ